MAQRAILVIGTAVNSAANRTHVSNSPLESLVQSIDWIWHLNGSQIVLEGA